MPLRSLRPGGTGSRGRAGVPVRRPAVRAARVVLAAVVVATVSTVAVGRPAAATAPVSTLGVYVGPGDPGSVDHLATELGERPTYAMDFLDPSSWSAFTDPTWPVQVWAGYGYQMIWGVPMLPNSGGSMATGAAGGYDANFQLLAKNFVAQGQGSSIIRIGWEFNGSWFPWGTTSSTPAQFVAYWIHIVDAMRSVPGANFRFEWNPTRGGNVDPAAYYPGNQYVDIVGLDVYDTEWATYPGASAEFGYIESGPYGLDWLNSFSAAHGKPMAFPEWGLGWGPSAPGSGPITSEGTQVCGGDDPTFVTDMVNWIGSHNVVEATFWDYQLQIDNGQNPETLAALGAGFATGGTGTEGAVTSTPTVTTSGPSGNSEDQGTGYRMVASDGGIFAFGAPALGSMGGQHLNAPIVGMAFDSATGGYYEVASDGGIFAFGAPSLGSMGAEHLSAPIVGMTA